LKLDNESLQDLKRKANAAFKSKDFELTFALSEKLAKENVPSALFTCGLIMEKGWLKGAKDPDRAFHFYRDLAIKFNDPEGYLGCVRVFLARHELDNRERAVRFCLGATDGRLKHLAFLLLGRIYEEMYEPPEYKLARKAYLKSFFAGSAWALRQYAMSLMKSNHVIGGVLMHVVATIVSPIFVLFRGLRTTRTG
jgi:hypothetical protein